MLSKTSRACGALLFFALLGFSVGCGSGSKARAIVKGTVTFGDKALTVGSVMFYGQNNLTASASIEKDGTYVINDAPVGDVKITVSVQKGGKQKMFPGGFKPNLPKNAKSVDPEGSGRSIPLLPEMPSDVVSIPEKYADVATSPLTFTVAKGEQTHDIKLTK